MNESLRELWERGREKRRERKMKEIQRKKTCLRFPKFRVKFLREFVELKETKKCVFEERERNSRKVTGYENIRFGKEMRKGNW